MDEVRRRIAIRGAFLVLNRGDGETRRAMKREARVGMAASRGRASRTADDDDAVLAVCRRWIDLMAEDAWEAALALVPPGEEGLASPADLRRYISNYGSLDPPKDGSSWRVTHVVDARLDPSRPGHKPYAEVESSDDGRSGSVVIDLPLNGEWSDFTAVIEFDGYPYAPAYHLAQLDVL